MELGRLVSLGRHEGATVTKAITIRGSSGATIVGGPVVDDYGRAAGAAAAPIR